MFTYLNKNFSSQIMGLVRESNSALSRTKPDPYY